MRKESSLFFPFPSGSNLSKVTKSREKCERKARFSFHSRVAVTYPKLRKVESKTKNSFFFLPRRSKFGKARVTKSREQNKEFILFLPRRSKFGEAKVTKSRWKNQEKYHFVPSFYVFATAFQALSPHCCKMRRQSHVIFEKRKKKVGSCRSPAYLCNRNNKRQATCHSMNPFKKVQL